jgi:competence ComEA-like helix-hairpin-helix protein
MMPQSIVLLRLAALALSGLALHCAPEPIRLHPVPPGVEYPWSAASAPTEGPADGSGTPIEQLFARVADARETARQVPAQAQTAIPEPAHDRAPASERPNPARSAAPEPTEAPERTAALPSEASTQRIDLNAATLAELDTLPRVGPALAQRIVDARPFARVEQLRRVRGIGDATFAQLRDRVTVGPAVPDEGSMVF